MNNVKNDERYFVKDVKKKSFSIKLTEEEHLRYFNRSSDFGLHTFEVNLNYDEEVKQELINRLKCRLEHLKKAFINELKGQVTDNKLYIKLDFKDLMKLIRGYEFKIVNLEKEIGLKEFGLECLKKKNKVYTNDIKPMI